MLQDAESSGWSQELGKKAEEYCLTTIGGFPQFWSQIQTEWDRCTDTCVHVVLSPAWCSRFFEICCCALLQDVCMMHDDLVWHWPLSASGEVGSAQVKGLKWTSFQEEKDVGNAWNAACDTCYYVTIASKSSQPARQNHAKPTKQALEIGNGFCLEHGKRSMANLAKVS